MRDVQPKELTVSKSDSPRSVHLNGILVVLPDFDDLARLVPTSWRITRLILDTDPVSHFQWGHFLGVR